MKKIHIFKVPKNSFTFFPLTNTCIIPRLLWAIICQDYRACPYRTTASNNVILILELCLMSDPFLNSNPNQFIFAIAEWTHWTCSKANMCECVLSVTVGFASSCSIRTLGAGLSRAKKPSPPSAPSPPSRPAPAARDDYYFFLYIYFSNVLNFVFSSQKKFNKSFHFFFIFYCWDVTACWEK